MGLLRTAQNDADGSGGTSDEVSAGCRYNLLTTAQNEYGQ